MILPHSRAAPHTVTQAEESVTQEKRRRHDVPALPNKKFFLSALGVSAVNCALLHDQRHQIPMRRSARSRSRHRKRDVPNPVGVPTLTVADPDFVGSAVAVAVTFTAAGFGTTAGLVQSPHERPVVLGSHSRKAKVEETENCRQRERIGPNSRQSLEQVRSSGLPFTGCRIRAILRVIHTIYSK